MTRDEIKLPPYLCASYEGDDLYSGDQLMDVVRSAVLAEREACAKLCDEVSLQAVTAWKLAYQPQEQGREMGADDCAAAIRARGDSNAP